MSKNYPPLPIYHLKAGLTCATPYELPVVAHLEDPALRVMVDFKSIKPAIVGLEEPIDSALVAARNCSYHALLVVDRHGCIAGIVSAEDLLGERPLQVLQERRLPRADLQVQMVMTPQHEIITIDFEDLRHAKVGHIITTLHNHKQHYALVTKTDPATTVAQVRGLFYSSQISKQLGKDVTSDLSAAHSLAELQHDLHLHD